MPYANYHTGIVGENDNQVWRRISDGVEVQLEGWNHRGRYPKRNQGYTNLYWEYFNNRNKKTKNALWNAYSRSQNFICEYIE